MISLSRLACVSSVVVGLTLAACSGGQTEAIAEEAPEQQSEKQAVVASTDRVDSATDTTSDEASGATDVPEDPVIPGSLPLSELADRVVELPSAFPERVLDGLGDPIGRPPATLELPALGISSAPVLPVGLEPNGELQVPGASEVGWYQFGAGVDGGVGSVVFAAHIAYNGRNGVFSTLAETEIGDEIVVGADGADEDLTYRVVSIDQYNKFDLPIDDLFSESSEERIVLITCGGSFNPNLQSYDDNVVVVAVPA